MRKFVIFALLAILLGSGCAWIEQSREDIALSNATPLAEGERDPVDSGAKFGQLFAALPYGAGAVAVPLMGWLASEWLRRKRGRAIRLAQGQAISAKPITGTLGKATGLEYLVQFAADLRAAIFEVGAQGTPLHRAWKVLLYGVLGSAAFAPVVYPPIIDAINTFISAPPDWLNGTALTAATGIGAAIVAWLERKADKVLPINDGINPG